MKEEAQTIYRFIEFSEGLKRELRHNWLSNGKQEDVAEHSWRMALMAVIIAPKTKFKLDLEKVFKLIAVHDLVEIEAKDVPAFRHMTSQDLAEEKNNNEVQAIQKIKEMLDKETGEEIYNLWLEFEKRETIEAGFVNILDKLEARIQKSQQPKEMLVEEEYNLDFVNKYTAKMTKLCMEDEFLLELNEIAKEKRLNLIEKD